MKTLVVLENIAGFRFYWSFKCA